IRQEREHVTAREALDGCDESVFHRVLERVSGFLNDRRALQLDHRLLDVGVDACEYADEQLAAEQQRLGGHRRAVVVALVKRDHRVGHGDKELVAVERRGGGRNNGLLSCPSGWLRARGRRARTQRTLRRYLSANRLAIAWVSRPTRERRLRCDIRSLGWSCRGGVVALTEIGAPRERRAGGSCVARACC